MKKIENYCDFSNKTVVITGSTSGIGLFLAKYFLLHNANVMLNGLGSDEDIKKISEELRNISSNGSFSFHPANMKHREEIEDLIDFTVEKFSSIDILINNAGIQKVAKIEEIEADKIDDIISICLKSNFHTIRKSLPYMKKQKFGRIINIASVHGVVASPYKAAYVAAKHGVIGLTKTVALETAEYGITCNAVCPGYVKTPIVENQVADQARIYNVSNEEAIRDYMLAAQPIKNFIEYEELAAMVFFLASPLGKNVTGAQYLIDAGWTAR